jgi:hypothetical protein
MNISEKIKFITRMIDGSNGQLTDYILGIIISNGVDHTTNKNGIFINLSVLDNDVLDYIYNLITTQAVSDNIYASSETGDGDDSTTRKAVVSRSKEKDKVCMDPIDDVCLSLSRQFLTI